MPKKSKKLPKPITLTLTLVPESDGSVAITYQGDDPRTFLVGDALIEAIAVAEGCEVEQIFVGESL